MQCPPAVAHHRPPPAPGPPPSLWPTMPRLPRCSYRSLAPFSRTPLCFPIHNNDNLRSEAPVLPNAWFFTTARVLAAAALAVHTVPLCTSNCCWGARIKSSCARQTHLIAQLTLAHEYDQNPVQIRAWAGFRIDKFENARVDAAKLLPHIEFRGESIFAFDDGLGLTTRV